MLALRFAREHRWLLAIVVVALAVRLWWLAQVPTPEPSAADPAWYFIAARNLAAGHGLTVGIPLTADGYVAGPGGIEAVRWPQGYSITLAGAFVAFGTSLATAKAVNLVAGVALVPITYALGDRLFGRAVGIASAAVLAMYPAHIAWTSVLYADLLFAVPFALTMVLLVRANAPPRPAYALAVGLVIGYAAIVRPQAVVLLPAAFIYWYAQNRDLRPLIGPASMLALGVAVWVIPMSVWNTARSGELTFVSRNFGYNLRIGHAPYSTGRYVTPEDLWATAVKDEGLGAIPDESIATRRAMSYAVSHPIREIELSARKVFYLYTTDSDAIAWSANFGEVEMFGSADAEDRLALLADLSAYAVIVLGVASLPYTFRLRGELLFVWLVLAFWTAIHVVFFGEPRYRLPILPILLVFVGVALCTLKDMAFGKAATPTEAQARLEEARD